VLRAHPGKDDQVNPDARRAAFRVFERAFGRAPQPNSMDCRELQFLVVQLTRSELGR
jgi:hypothetical protein